MADTILKQILARNPGEKEFHQAVKEFIETIKPVLDRHPEYGQLGVIERAHGTRTRHHVSGALDG